MILKALEMQGFKSFPEKTVLEFKNGITAVVGPNGSGKSNISDAVRWVLGEQSSKSLRGSKMEDVIFDGTKLRKAHGFAQVTLKLDNTDRSIAGVDEDEVAVTRRFFRSGESEYKINGNTVRLRDIHELFMDTGLGRDGYSMVSQGKIAEMISGKSKECREMLEEACGISAYRYRRTDSLRRLSQAEDNLVRLRDILSELEGRIGPLKTQSEKAQKFLVLSKDKREQEISLWLYNIDKLKESIKKQEDSLSIANSQYEKVQAELSEIEEKIEKAIENAQQITVSIDEIRLQNSNSEQQAAKLDSDRAVLKNTIEHNLSTIERIKGDKLSGDQTKAQLQREIETEQGLIAKIKEVALKKQRELEDLKASQQEKLNEGSSLSKESEDLMQNNAKLSSRLSECRIEQSSAKSSVNEIGLRLSQLTELLSDRKAEAKRIENEKLQIEEALKENEKGLAAASSRVSEISTKLLSEEEKADKLKKGLDEKRFELQHLESKQKMLTELEQNMDGYSGAVKAVIKEGKKGALSGIHGTVAKLVSIEDRFTLAIETALGNAVQNIICDTEENAKNAINFLKGNRAGRATFQPISSVRAKSFDESGLSDYKGFVAMANELVSYDEKYDSIILSLLGRIAVCEDIDSAIVLARGYDYHFKSVTLDGQIINAGGSMTGGSQSKNAGILSRSAEIERLSKKHGELKAECEKISEAYSSLCSLLDSLQKELDEEKAKQLSLQESKIRIEGEARLKAQQYGDILNALKQLQNEEKLCSERYASLDSEIEKSDERLKTLAIEFEQNEQKLGELEKQRLQISLESERYNSQISRIKLDLHDADKDLAARTEAMNLLKARLVSHENKDNELDNEIEAINKKNDELKDRIASLSEVAEFLREGVEKSKNDILLLQKQRSEAEANSGTLRVSEKEKMTERENLKSELARLEERKGTMTAELDETINKLYDEYTLTLRQASAEYTKTDEPAATKRALGEIKAKIRSLGSVNVSAIEEYKQVSERYEFMSSQLGDVEKSKRELSRLINELTDKMSVRFREQFTRINQYFGETFKELFAGGRAEIVLQDPADVLESEIDIKLQPPGKNVKRLDALSGGEKGLSAIALLFAIMKVNPAPFCIFDEVEAALDDANVTRYAQYVRRMTKNTQFILITHRRGTMEEADVLYGITMQEQGVSKLLELKTAELASRLGI